MRGIVGLRANLLVDAKVKPKQAFLSVLRVGQAFLPAIEFVSGGHSCPPERIRIRSEGKNAPAHGFKTDKNDGPTLKTDKNVCPT